MENKPLASYEATALSRYELSQIYQRNLSSSKYTKAVNCTLLNFEKTDFFNICHQKSAITESVEKLSLSLPLHIIDVIVNLQLNDAQLFIESKSKEIQTILHKTRADINYFPLFLCRDIILYSGGYCWDANFWAIGRSYYNDRDLVPLHIYVHFDRVVFYCGHQDVIYCKSDEYVYGSRYFVNIEIDSKGENMWLGVVWKDEYDWSRRRGEDKIAYHGGRYRSTNDLVDKFKNKFNKLYESLEDKSNLELEMSCIQHASECGHDFNTASSSLWDGAFGGIHGRGKIESLPLPYYGSGDVIGIMVDKIEGIIYFYKNNTLVWFLATKEIKTHKCKVFGSTDTRNDTLIYNRMSWNEQRENDLRKQVQYLRENRPEIDAYSSYLPFSK